MGARVSIKSKPDSPARAALAAHLARCADAGRAIEAAREPLARLAGATDQAQRAAEALAEFDAAEDSRLAEWAASGDGLRPEPRLAARQALLAAFNDAGVAASSAERIKPGLESAVGDALRNASALSAAIPRAIDGVLGEELEVLIADVREKMLEGERVQFVIAAHFDVLGQRARARDDIAALREIERLGKLAAAPLPPLMTPGECRLRVQQLAEALGTDPGAQIEPGTPSQSKAA